MDDFEVRRGKVLLGILRLLDVDQPWFMCEFAPTPDFEDVKPLFDEELRRLEVIDDDIDAWENAYSRIDELGLQIVPPGGGPPLTEFVLHIEGNRARFTK